MRHANRNWVHGLLGLAAIGIALAFGLPPVLTLVLIICPLVMRFMAGMGADDDHAGHGGEHDPMLDESPSTRSKP
jgi:hypothetical protein